VSTTSGDVLNALRGYRFRYANEEQLQQGVETALRASGLPTQREVRLSARDRIDLLVGRVGIEVKVASNWETVLRQLRRYARSDLLDEIVLVTDRVRHGRIPLELDGKPVHVHCLAMNGF
jgi:hypothetical protein